VSTCIVPGSNNSMSKHLAGMSYFQFPERWWQRLKAVNACKYGEKAFKLDDHEHRKTERNCHSIN